MTGGRIVAAVIGSLLVLAGLAIAAGGGALLWADRNQRDADGWFTSPSGAPAAPARALVSDEIDLGAEADADRVGEIGRARSRSRPRRACASTCSAASPQAS